MNDFYTQTIQHTVEITQLLNEYNDHQIYLALELKSCEKDRLRAQVQHEELVEDEHDTHQPLHSMAHLIITDTSKEAEQVRRELELDLEHAKDDTLKTVHIDEPEAEHESEDFQPTGMEHEENLESTPHAEQVQQLEQHHHSDDSNQHKDYDDEEPTLVDIMIEDPDNNKSANHHHHANEEEGNDGEDD